MTPDSGSALVRFAVRLPASVPSLDATPSSTELSESSTHETLTRTEPATTIGSRNTELGSLRIPDDLYELGRLHDQVLQSPSLENSFAEIAWLRRLVAAQSKTLNWYRQKVQELAHHILTRRDK